MIFEAIVLYCMVGFAYAIFAGVAGYIKGLIHSGCIIETIIVLIAFIPGWPFILWDTIKGSKK